MEDLEKRRKDMYQGLWFGTIVLIIIIIAMWIFAKNDFKGNGLIWFTSFCVIGIIGSWLAYIYQREKDKKPKIKNNAGDKIIKINNKIHGEFLRLWTIKWISLMILFIGGGIYILIIGGLYWWLGFILIALGLALIIVIKNLWKMGGQKLKGRYY